MHLLVALAGGQTHNLGVLGWHSDQLSYLAWASPRNFQIYSIVLLTIVTMLYYIPRTYLPYNWKFVPLITFTCPHRSASDSYHQSVLCIWVCFFKIPHISEIIHMVFVFFCLTFFTWHNALKTHLCCHKWQCLLFYDRVTYHCINIPHLKKSIHLLMGTF